MINKVATVKFVGRQHLANWFYIIRQFVLEMIQRMKYFSFDFLACQSTAAVLDYKTIFVCLFLQMRNLDCRKILKFGLIWHPFKEELESRNFNQNISILTKMWCS